METDRPSGAPRRRRALRNLRRSAAPVAALTVAALLAGCGTASSGSGTGTSAGPATTNTNDFNPNLVPAGGSSPGTPPKAGQKKSAQKAGTSKTGGKRAGGAGSGSSTGGASGPGGSGTVGGAGGGQVAGPSAPVTPTRTVTVTHTDTVTHTVTQTKYVRPNVPSGAGLPSRSAALSVSRFDAAGGNIGCRISGGSVRCDVARRVWSPPRKPSSCHAAWGQGLMVGSSGSSFFVCARNSVLDPTGTYIKPGYDDKVGSVTCQVRSFGVTCFESDGRGFFVGRTGYTRF